jgi:hypothetical protein
VRSKSIKSPCDLSISDGPVRTDGDGLECPNSIDKKEGCRTDSFLVTY